MPPTPLNPYLALCRLAQKHQMHHKHGSSSTESPGPAPYGSGLGRRFNTELQRVTSPWARGTVSRRVEETRGGVVGAGDQLPQATVAVKNTNCVS